MTKKALFIPLVLGACAWAQTPPQTGAPAAGHPLSAAPKPAAQGAPAPRPTAPAVPATRVAIINIQQAIVATQEGQRAGAELQAKFNPRRTALEKRQTEIGGMQDQLKKGGATMAEAAKQKIMRDIDSGTRSLNHDADDLNADMEQENNKIMQDLGTKMMSIMDQYAAQNGFAVVLDVSNQQNPVFWADPSTFITADIVKLYDQAHPVMAAKPAAKPSAPAAPKTAPVPPATKKQ